MDDRVERLEDGLRQPRAELQEVRRHTLTIGEVVVTVLLVLLAIVCFVPLVVLFLTLWAIGATMRLLDRVTGGQARIADRGAG